MKIGTNEKINSIDKLNDFLNTHANLMGCIFERLIINEDMSLNMDAYKITLEFISFLNNSIKKYQRNALYNTDFNI